MDEFVQQYGCRLCGASASYMFEEENPLGNKNLLSKSSVEFTVASSTLKQSQIDYVLGK
jgi:hypothetical protein